mgnify:CR=1 FL=1
MYGLWDVTHVTKKICHKCSRQERKEHGFSMGMTRSLLQRRQLHDRVWYMRPYTCRQENMPQVLKTREEGRWVFNGDGKVITQIRELHDHVWSMRPYTWLCGITIALQGYILHTNYVEDAFKNIGISMYLNA